MAGPKSVLAWICCGILISLILPVIGTVVAEVLLPAFFFAHLPLHSLIEAAGGIIALAVAGILRAEMLRKEDTAYYRWMILALIGMGVLDLFHAASHPGVHFVWLHSLATFVGGVLFALVWVNARGPKFITSLRFQLTYVVLFALVGMTSILRAEILPTMTATSNQQFSTIALMLNFVGGVGFLVAAAFFTKRFFAMTKFEDWLFAVHTTLFGVAGVLFVYSVLWDGSWWWLHVLRLAAFTIALVYGLKIFHDAQIEMQLVNFRLNESNAALDRTVAERTAKLLQSEERFQLAVRGSTDGIWDWNVLTNEVYYSPRFKELIGYSDEEFPNVFSSFESRLHSEDHDSTLQRVNEHLTKQRPYDVEYRLLTKSGEYRWFRARGQAIWSSNGQPERMAGSITDITEEHLLRERFRLAVEASPAALLMLDQSGIILMANSRSATLFGYENGELIGQSAEILLTTKLRREYPNHRDHFFEDLRLQAMGAELDLLAVRKDGTNFPAKVGLSPVATAGGQAIICGVMDITHQVIALDTMRQAKEQAESASRAKSSFLANMSHEIRTPMNGIIGMVQLLSQTDLRSNQRDYLATVDESAHVLLRLLNDILDFSKIEAGKLELECVEFRLSECVTRTTQLLLLRAAEKGLEIACRIAPDVPDYLRGDCGRLQQVLVNLIGNAIKFTEAGEIVVNIFTVSLSNSHVRLQISISDTGIGIPQGKLDEIFHPFEQAESSTTRRFGGTGLGLAISKQLVSMMDGRLWVESEFGKGSTFHFTVQVQVSPNQHLREPAELASLKGLTVLIIDDNATNRRFLKEIAEYWEMHPILADSAAAARSILEETSGSGSRMPIQLILLDHHMPSEDGFKFAESLRQLPAPVRCPIFMISSSGISADSEDMRKLGIERFMTKPVIASDLLNKLLELFGRSGKPTPPVSSVADLATTAPRRILLVEDNEINRRVASAMLRSRGHQVIMLENGQEAVDILANEEFDVVLMDMQMPIMDGYLATAEIRKREKKTGGHIPIVAMTAEALKGDREHCLVSGMDDYVSKPILQVELFRAVERFPAVCLDATRSSAVEKAIQCTPATQPQVVESQLSSVPPPQPRAMDWSLAKERLPGGPKMMQEFVNLFKQDSPARLLDIRHAIETRDAELLRRSSHTLKSNLNYFGATTAAELALSLETLGRNKSFDQAESLLAALEKEFARVLEEMNLPTD
jgi:two-component system, sensor histidine kinase and response regulator